MKYLNMKGNCGIETATTSTIKFKDGTSLKPQRMRTNTNAYKSAIENYLLDCIDIDGETNGTPTVKIQYFFDRFESEFNHSYEIHRTPNRQDRIADYLQGLPIAIDFYYYKILKVAKTLLQVESFTDKQEDKICSNWWNHCAFHLIRLQEKYSA